MISLLVTFLPFIFVLYFIYRSYNEPVFVMGIPFLMFFGSCIFFDQVNLFRIPFRSFESIAENLDITILAWLIICWAIFKLRNYNHPKKDIDNKYSKKHVNILDYFIILLMIITIIGLGVVIMEYYIVENVYDKFFILMSLFLGYFIIKDVAYHTENDVLKDFLFTIVIINSIASGMYFIHQGLHISLYTNSNEYLTETVDGETITRTFWFMPNLLFFSISYLLVIRKRKSLINTILLLVNILAVYISYTRTSLIIVIMLIIIYFLLIGYKEANFGKSIKGLLIAGIASLALFFAVSSFLPTSTKYFLKRFNELESRPAEANNLVYRFYKTGLVINRIGPEKELFGYGSVTETQLPFLKFVKKATDDMAWAEVVFRWGYLGLILFILLYIISIIKSFFLFMSTDGIVSKLSLLLLLMIFSQLIDSFTQSTIMYPNRFSLALWYFGILSALLIANYGNVNSKGVEIVNS